jgi:hypothetical protein
VCIRNIFQRIISLPPMMMMMMMTMTIVAAVVRQFHLDAANIVDAIVTIGGGYVNHIDQSPVVVLVLAASFVVRFSIIPFIVSTTKATANTIANTVATTIATITNAKTNTNTTSAMRIVVQIDSHRPPAAVGEQILERRRSLHPD